ncbi:sulfotransferase family protein [Novosphingobium aquimarinum]|uniref:sulfotransferase family protein n=1 Tax=Novosphingobium aquimarinum TaxID=2682494 RepID=UPI0012EC1706|nr:sulfotransferase family protein [Novosphingobium aquimarinum]
MALKIIGAGLGRTGTMSLKIAIEYLGFGPCLHMTEMFADIHRQLPLWLDAVDGHPDWDAIFEGFVSSCDHPSSDFWRELHAYYPEAKVVLTTRSAESWYASVTSTIYNDDNFAAMPENPLKNILTRHIGPQPRDILKDKAAAIAWFEAREAEIIATVPSDQLLVLPVGSGWEPLCEFLGVDVPDVAYPKVNSAEEWHESATRPPPPGAPEGLDFIVMMGNAMLATMRAQAWR